MLPPLAAHQKQEQVLTVQVLHPMQVELRTAVRQVVLVLLLMWQLQHRRSFWSWLRHHCRWLTGRTDHLW
jgi:hypothetical protein